MARGPQRRQVVEDTFGAMKRVMGAMHGRMRAALSETDLSPPQVFLLRILEAGGEATPKDLAAALGTSAANITGLLNKLEEADLVARRRDTKDRRAVYVAITSKAEARLGELHEATIRSVAVVFDDWTIEEIEDLKGYLERLGKDCC